MTHLERIRRERGDDSVTAEQLVEEFAEKYDNLAETVWQLKMGSAGHEQITGSTPEEEITLLVRALKQEIAELAARVAEPEKKAGKAE